MKSTYTELALYGSKNKCARTDHVFLPISEVCDGTVSLALTLDVKVLWFVYQVTVCVKKWHNNAIVGSISKVQL